MQFTVQLKEDSINSFLCDVTNAVNCFIPPLSWGVSSNLGATKFGGKLNGSKIVWGTYLEGLRGPHYFSIERSLYWSGGVSYVRILYHKSYTTNIHHESYTANIYHESYTTNIYHKSYTTNIYHESYTTKCQVFRFSQFFLPKANLYRGPSEKSCSLFWHVFLLTRI